MPTKPTKPKLTQHDLDLQKQEYKQSTANIEEMIKKLSEKFKVVEGKKKENQEVQNFKNLFGILN